MTRKIKKLPSGAYRIQITTGRIWNEQKNRWDYERISLTAPTEPELRMMEAEYDITHTIERGTINPVLKVAIREYINKREGILAPSTLHAYRFMLDNGFPDLMDMRVKEITNDIMARAVQREYARKNVQTGRPISAKTVKNEYGMISSVCREYGVTFNIRLKSWKAPVHDISMPESIFAAVKGTEIELPVLLAMWLSFTMSEIRGLTKSGSLKGNLLYIHQVKVYVKGQDLVKPVAKNTTRNRGIILPDYLRKLIDAVQTDEIVPMKPFQITKRFKTALKRAGLPDMTFHDLRHVSASTMEMLGVPDEYKRQRGGWSTDSTMKSVYVQAFNSVRREYDKKIDDYFNGILGDG